MFQIDQDNANKHEFDHFQFKVNNRSSPGKLREKSVN